RGHVTKYFLCGWIRKRLNREFACGSVRFPALIFVGEIGGIVGNGRKRRQMSASCPGQSYETGGLHKYLSTFLRYNRQRGYVSFAAVSIPRLEPTFSCRNVRKYLSIPQVRRSQFVDFLPVLCCFRI